VPVPVIGPARVTDIQHYAPNNRANLNLDYQFGPFAAVLHQNYYGSFRDENDYPGQLFAASGPRISICPTCSGTTSLPPLAARTSSTRTRTGSPQRYQQGLPANEQPGRWRGIPAYRRTVRLQWSNSSTFDWQPSSDSSGAPRVKRREGFSRRCVTDNAAQRICRWAVAFGAAAAALLMRPASAQTIVSGLRMRLYLPNTPPSAALKSWCAVY